MIKVKNWEKYQHFKYRRPSWIKLYASLLDSRSWGLLPDSPAKTLINVWLSASRTEGVLDPFDKLAYITRMPIETLNEHMEILMASGNWFEEVPDPVAKEPEPQAPPVQTIHQPRSPSPYSSDPALSPGRSAFDAVRKRMEEKHVPAARREPGQ